MQISPSLFPFLTQLAANNNREWFAANKKAYDTEKLAFDKVIEYLLKTIGAFEDIDGQRVSDCAYRIYRDVRFSADKSPYKRHFACSFEQGGKKSGRAGYYLHLEPGNCFLAGGAWGPSKEQLAAIRQEIDYNPSELLGILENHDFKALFDKIEGEALKTAPKGYDKDHPNINLLRQNQYYVLHKYTDAEVLAPGFLEKFVSHCRTMKPFADWCNMVCFG
jgi:uncharacterized protein (TIGR02453 family)